MPLPNVTDTTANAVVGRALLEAAPAKAHFKDVVSCLHLAVLHASHPFGLDTGSQKEIMFVGSRDSMEWSVESFLARIRERVIQGGQRLHRLRIIRHPVAPGIPDCYIFFEAWINHEVVISGHTANMGSGQEQRDNLECVFAALSQMYELEIEHVFSPNPIVLLQLYEKI